MLEFVVVGTGRCGTSFASKLITLAGRQCGHEMVFTFNGVDTVLKELLSGDSSWLAVPFLDVCYLLEPNLKIIHLVRNPIKVFRSWLFDQSSVLSLNPDPNMTAYSRYLIKHYPDVMCEDKAIDKAAIYYLQCNKIILKYQNSSRYLLHRVEDSPRRMLSFLHCVPDVAYEYLINTNTRNVKKVPDEEALAMIKTSKYYDELKAMFLHFYPELGVNYEL